MDNVCREGMIHIREVLGAAPHLEIRVTSSNKRGAGVTSSDTLKEFSDCYAVLFNDIFTYIDSLGNRANLTHETKHSPDNPSVTAVFKIPC